MFLLIILISAEFFFFDGWKRYFLGDAQGIDYILVRSFNTLGLVATFEPTVGFR